MLRLCGAPAGPLPPLSELQDRLVAGESPLTRMVAAAIEPAWRIRAAQTALSRPERLFGAGKALHQATTRNGPAELPWFAPFADAQEAA